MVDREVQWRYPIMAALVTAFIFSGIFGAGLMLNDYKVNALQDRMERVEVEQNSRLIGQELSTSLEEDRCRAIGRWMNVTVEDLRTLKKEVSSYESSSKIQSERFRSGKKRYTNLMLQNLVQVKKYNTNCQNDIVTVVYFYEEGCDACKDQGTILTEIRRSYDRDVVVYPLDTELEMPAVRFLSEYYNVTEYPTLVVDGDRMSGFQSIDKVESKIDSKMNSSTTSDIPELSDQYE